MNRRGIFSGYEVAFTQQIPLQGRGATDQKRHFDIDRAADRVDGWFSHNLNREISKRKRWVRFTASDVYAYCDQGTPMVVMPARHPGPQLAPLTMHKLDPVWVSPQAIVDRIKADYQNIPNWQTTNVYEVVPTEDLRSLTDEQLADLQRRVAEETACRLTKTCPAN
ncbi:MAG TPA: hypothetical protein VFX60_05515 [Micromonospora sp.]|nr:hypothetical protein [Micromonospora sp.]